MGGFVIYSDNYIFKSKPFIYCNCIGMHVNVNLEAEKILLDNKTQKISDELLTKINVYKNGAHIGNDLNYNISKNIDGIKVQTMYHNYPKIP